MSTYILKPNSIKGEYYCGDLPGNLQYKKDLRALASLTVPKEEPAPHSWTHYPLTDEYRAALLPHTKKPAQWRLIMVMGSARQDGEIWLKGALMNIATAEIALMTACNRKATILSHGNRAIDSNSPDWFVGHYRMGAPLIYWEELKKVCQTICDASPC